jgi:hypothetical protein
MRSDRVSSILVIIPRITHEGPSWALITAFEEHFRYICKPKYISKTTFKIHCVISGTCVVVFERECFVDRASQQLRSPIYFSESVVVPENPLDSSKTFLLKSGNEEEGGVKEGG